MPRLVVDAGVLAVALVDDASVGRRVRDRLLGHSLYAPETIDLEVASVIRKHVLPENLSPDRAAQAIQDLAAVPLVRVSHRPLLDRIWQLHPNVTPYDAAYIAVAELLDAPLITADVRLSRAPGTRCEFDVLAE
ncbi:MAG: type II toxin-antitoxin system VapC family toxin [Natronosporangium sp.]